MQCPFADLRYYRNALRGLLLEVVQLFCEKAYTQERPGTRAAGALTLRAQWA